MKLLPLQLSVVLFLAVVGTLRAELPKPFQAQPLPEAQFTGDGQQKVGQAYRALTEKKWAEAETLFQEARADRSSVQAALEGLMWLEMARNQLKRAFVYANLRNKLSPRDLNWIPKFLEVQRLNPEQRKYVGTLFAAYVKHRPDDLRTALYYADFCSWMPETRPLAVTLYRNLVKRNRANMDAWIGLVGTMMREGKFDEALVYYKRLPKRTLTESTDYVLLKALHASGERLSALKFADGAIHRYPQSIHLRAERAAIETEIAHLGGIRELTMEKQMEIAKKNGWVINALDPTLEVLSESTGFTRLSLYASLKSVYREKTRFGFSLSGDTISSGSETLNRFGTKFLAEQAVSRFFSLGGFYKLNVVPRGRASHTFEFGPGLFTEDKAARVYLGVRQSDILDSPPDSDMVPFSNRAGSSGLTPAAMRYGYRVLEGFISSAVGGQYGYVYESANYGSLSDHNTRLGLAAGAGVRIPSERVVPKSAFFARVDLYYGAFSLRSTEYFSPSSFWSLTPSLSGELQDVGRFSFGASLGWAFNSFRQNGLVFGLQTVYKFSPHVGAKFRVHRTQVQSYNLFGAVAAMEFSF